MVAAVNGEQQQMQALIEQVRVLTQQAELQQANIREMDLKRTQDLQGMIALQAQVIAAGNKKTRTTFVDIKGIGKPSTFSSETKQFGTWAFKLGNFLEGVLSGMKDAIEWAQEQDTVILDASPIDALLDGADHRDMGRQLYAVLAQLCEGEALDLVQNVINSDGWEAWRVLSRRFDPQGAGRRRNIMTQLLQPGSFEPKDLNSAIARWEEKVRIYERRSATRLPDDIKSSILAEMAKGALKEHLILNAAKLKNYDGVREEIQCYLENRQNAEPIAMDVDAFGHKGKGKKGKDGKDGKGGGDNCRNCGKMGHWAKDCWAAGGSKADPMGKGKGKGKTKATSEYFEGECRNCGKWGHKADVCRSAAKNDKGKGKGKKGKPVNSVEPETAVEEQNLGGLDLCAVWNDWPEDDDDYENIEATIDSGAACCVFPKELCRHIKIKPCAESARGAMFRTASGQTVAHEGNRTIECITDNGLVRRLTGAVTGVRKVLLAVSRLTETGHRVFFDKDGGYIENRQDGSKIPMILKDGVYIIKLRIRAQRQQRTELGQLSGGMWQANRL
jgi:hypothetical protein